MAAGEDEAVHDVVLHLYDLSQGMARTMSAALLGRQIEGIWHTGVVVHGVEWYFGGGVQHGAPGRTPYGAPVRAIPLGKTALDAQVLADYMRDLSGKYTPASYSLLRNNCNNFCDEVSSFLVGKGIPEFITGLPADVLQTPMGQMLAPMIENFERQARTQGGGDVGLGLGQGFGAAAAAAAAPTATAAHPAATAAIAVAADPQPTYGKGDTVWYTPSEGERVAATVVGVYVDDPPPYFTIKGAFGERQTVAKRLAPRDPQTDARTAAAEAAQRRADDSAKKKAAHKKAVAEEFAKIMAEGGRTPNEAAAEAVKKVRQRQRAQQGAA